MRAVRALSIVFGIRGVSDWWIDGVGGNGWMDGCTFGGRVCLFVSVVWGWVDIEID